MTITNVKNMPDLPRTDDLGTIMGNFVSYYGELYCDKPVDMPTLDRMIGNLTLKLDEKDVATLGVPISMNKVREVLGNVPRGKTPGPDLLPYEIYRALPTWAYRQRECGGPREQNCRCRYGSLNHMTIL